MDKINNIKYVFKGQFKMTNLGSCQYYLSIEMTRYYNHDFIHLLLSTYIKKVLHQFGLIGCHFISTPMDRKEYLRLEYSNTDLDPKILE